MGLDHKREKFFTFFFVGAVQMSASRNFCFTAFDMEVEPEFNEDFMRYLVYGMEVAPTTGRLHWQGFVQFLQPVRPSGVSKKLDMKGAHVERMRGTAKQAADYCKKEGKFEEKGKLCKGQGQRNDIGAAVDAIRSGVSDMELIMDHGNTFVKYNHGLKDVRRVCMKAAARRFRKIKVHVRWGPAGIGKTRGVMEAYEPHEVFKYESDGRGEW